jgi:hypothetical protein
MAVFQVTTAYTIGGGTAMNVMHFRHRIGGVGGAQEMWDRWNAFIEASYKTVISSNCAFLPLRVQEIGVTDGTVIYKAPLSTIGGAVGNPAPSNLAVVVGWRSNSPNRRKNGRTYFAGFPSTFVLGNVISPAGQSAFSTMLATFLTTFGKNGTDPYEAVVYSETNHKLHPNDIAQALTPIEQVRISAILRGQRRRQMDVGV